MGGDESHWRMIKDTHDTLNEKREPSAEMRINSLYSSTNYQLHTQHTPMFPLSPFATIPPFLPSNHNVPPVYSAIIPPLLSNCFTLYSLHFVACPSEFTKI